MRPIHALLILPLAACGDGAPFDGPPDTPLTDAAFAVPAADGTFALGLDDTTDGGLDNGSGAGFAWQIGTTTDGLGLLGVAGVLPGIDIGDGPTSGTAVFDGAYDYAIRTEVVRTDRTITWTETLAQGAIRMNVNFDTGRLTGSAGDLTVAGDFTSEDLDGTVTVAGITGTLDGIVGPNLAVGAFSGADDTSVFAGGFLVDD